MNNSVRHVGGALGVAILGSLLNSLYATRVRPSLSALPADQADTAGESLVGALSLGNPSIVDPAKHAFVSAMHITSIATCIVVVWLPGRNAALP